MEPACQAIGAYPHIETRVGVRDSCATFRWGGDMNEMSAALAAAAALTKLANGIWYYPDDDLLCESDEAVEAAKRDLEVEKPI